MAYASRLPASTALDTANTVVALEEEGEAMDAGVGATQKQNAKSAHA